ncbi:uncharacterized protein PHALS_01757 [Plasmopara halstedii]|uniref:Uncharacterized protein n=1 Tax=Plasmopara halstedii TaxID=4781 RepID=A0A0P1ATG0_PLAHL|nr:uncharacterized protein PHALS_01757 [Plasmopara halstedii]CEG45464.1 hypothetical protein PHALS_01757 [Plasmopara halstedii]|eukprot:XP_024581833.1 hypothetical protein PHALS_01757 [Plasmopara halstedii]
MPNNICLDNNTARVKVKGPESENSDEWTIVLYWNDLLHICEDSSSSCIISPNCFWTKAIATLRIS